MAKLIHLYRPQRTAPQNLEAILVARESLLREILSRLGKSEVGASRQHHLIIGPRGSGKTNLVRLIEHRLRKTIRLSKRWHPVSLSEEGYRVTTIADLLLETLRILAYDTRDPQIEGSHSQLKFDSDDARVIDLSLDALRNYCKNRGCGILLILENVNRLFERPKKQRSTLHHLRKMLIEEDWLTTICTSPTYLNAVTRPEEPLFEFFQVHVLRELTPDEQFELLKKLAILDNKVEFEKKLPEFRSQLQALYHFTGGNPRLAIMLFDLIANQNITDVKSELDRLLDQFTPFYQDRMKDLPEQEAKLLEFMALLPEGCTPTELAKESRMPAKLVRALMTRLEKTGYIRREERRRKRTVYIIPERFFRIWHQMNHSRQARGHIRYLLEFFSHWYATREERDKIWEELAAKFQQDLQEPEANNVRGSALTALGRIASEKPVPQLPRVVDNLVQELSKEPQKRAEAILRMLLRAALRSGNLNMIAEVVQTVARSTLGGRDLAQPYLIALNYLQEDRDPAILERQHPEMREAVELLVDTFDQGTPGQI